MIPKLFTCENPAFSSEEELHDYLESISAPKDLVCPITQELFLHPVIASDGHTYEKSAIRTWFDSQKNAAGSIRSPITNAYMETNGTGMVLLENKAVAGMARNYRDQLGDELCLRCQAIWDDVGNCIGDRGFRIKSLVEAGAELSIKKCRGGNTAFMALLQAPFAEDENLKFDLLNYFMVHNVPVSLFNDERKGCVDIIETILSSSEKSIGVAYRNLLNQIIEQCDAETELIRVKSEARDEENNELRERQRVLANNAENSNLDEENNEFANVNALGTMDEAWGYFPCMTALLYQGSVPEPPRTFAEEEKGLKKELNVILKLTFFAATTFWLLC